MACYHAPEVGFSKPGALPFSSTLPVHTPGHRGRTLILCFGLFSFGIAYPKLDYTIKELVWADTPGGCEV